MRDLKISIVVCIGMGLGAVLGFAGPLIVCLAHDAITKPSPGNGLMTVGFMFCFITIPLFTVAGGFWFRRIAIKK